MPRYPIYVVWAAGAGAFIPLMAMLNVHPGRALGDPARATAVLFLVGLSAASLVGMLLSNGLPDRRLFAPAGVLGFAGGLIKATYAVSVTLLAPCFGISKVILFAMTAQIVASTVIDHFRLLDAALRPVAALRLTGIVLVPAGLPISQMAAGSGVVGNPR